MTIHTFPARPRFRVLDKKPAPADVVPLPVIRQTVGEMAAAAIEKIAEESAKAERERESAQLMSELGFQLRGLADRALFVARFYGREETVEDLFQTITDRLKDDLKRR